MTWKSTAITSVVTGATALVGWFASPLPRTPAPYGVAPRAQTTQATSGSDIEEQAARLRARLRAEAVFRQPSRDLFRFAARAVPAQPRAAEPRLVEPSGSASAPQAPPLTLSGLATDVVDGQTVRTAIISAPEGILLAREGDSVVGLYRVEKIDDEAVELVRVIDGQPLRLRLSGARDLRP